MIRTFFWLFFSIITFGMGYYFGEHNTFHVSNRLTGIPSEITSKAMNLGHSLKGVRLWMALNDSKDHLNLASNALEEKNFGSAANEVKEARKKLEKAEDLAQEGLRKELKPVDHLIIESEASVTQLNPRAKNQVENAKKALEKIISK